MQPMNRRTGIWIAASLLLLSLFAAAIWLTADRGTPQEQLVAEIRRELARVETVQGRVTITLQGVSLQQELWVQRPGFFRTETEAGPSAFAGTIVVLNDQEGWVYSPALNMATVVDRAAYEEELADETGAGSILERMPDRILTALDQETQINVGERIQIAGRAVKLIEFVIAAGDPSLPAGVLQVWLDEQYSYPLAWRDSSGREMRFTNVTFNAEIDELTFLFFPPPGASVRRIEPGQ
jgi:outer membrane lipoprotein-sorting protein